MSFNDNDGSNFDDDDFFGDDDFLADDSSGGGFDDFGDDNFFDDDDGDDFFDDGGDNFFDDDEFSDAGDLEGGDFGQLDDDEVNFEQEQPQGASSGFRRGLAILGGLLVLQLLIILLLFFRPTGPTDIELTSTSIAATNAEIIVQATNAAGTANFAGTETAIAAAFTDTPSPSPTNTRPPTFTPTPTEEASPTLSETEQAIFALTEAAAEDANAELTAAALTAAATEEVVDFQGTATALAGLFANQTATAAARDDETPMDILTPMEATVAPVPVATELPDAGLFDDFAAGNSLGMIVLAAFGLLGVIAFSRRMRATSTDE